MSFKNLQQVGAEVSKIKTGLSFYANASFQTTAHDSVARWRGREQDHLCLVE